MYSAAILYFIYLIIKVNYYLYSMYNYLQFQELLEILPRIIITLSNLCIIGTLAELFTIINFNSYYIYM